MNRQLSIRSYFSLPTDLASELQDWPNKFTGGSGYNVNLYDPNTGESVRVQLIEDQDEVYVAISSAGCGTLFDRVAGRVIYALSAHSDNLMVDRHIPAFDREKPHQH